MTFTRLAATTAVLLALSGPPALADGPESVQARAANAAFLAEAPPPPTPGAVCVVDSGVDLNTDVAPAVISRFADDGGTPDDLGARSDTGEPLAKHGTYVAGVIASQIDGEGSSGIWPQAKIISVRVFGGADSRTTADAYIRAIDRCTNRADVKVINLSLAGLEASVSELASLEAVVSEARDAYGINVVAAAGNQGLDYIAYPAQFPAVFGVGATAAAGSFAAFSNRGSGLDISTLGTDVCLSYPSADRRATANGTSFSTPIVSAVAAAMRSYDPSITVAEAETYLVQSAHVTSAGPTLNAEAAFRLAGLDEVVDAYEDGPADGCAVPPTSNGAASGSPAPELKRVTRNPPTVQPAAPAPAPTNGFLMPAPEIAKPAARAPRIERLDRPSLRSMRFRRGVLTIRIRGFRKGMTAMFRVDGRRYARQRGGLRIRTPRWSNVRVRLTRAGARTSPALVIKCRDRLHTRRRLRQCGRISPDVERPLNHARLGRRDAGAEPIASRRGDLRSSELQRRAGPSRRTSGRCLAAGRGRRERVPVHAFVPQQ